ncbi:uncharacterized protein VTP21DRAFT_3257 [Calcarisporiella thermophila]|uniref:uncharacterized protein n=1 Tax=Calcarisporiella thermophila TaxID=911321 RepID=UPI0037426B90
MTRLYPRSTLRKIIKAHQPKSQLSKNADVMIYLDYVLFLKRLATEASIDASQSKENVIRANHINTALDRVLQQFKG